jgi:hypothetical protein
MSKPKSPNADQSSFLYPDLLDQLDPKHPFLQLARKIDWSIFEAEFSPLYSHRGTQVATSVYTLRRPGGFRCSLSAN